MEKAFCEPLMKLFRSTLKLRRHLSQYDAHEAW